MSLLRWLFGVPRFLLDLSEKKGKRKKDWRLKPGCKYYSFNKHGRGTGYIVFTCIARDMKNALRKFNNYKNTSLIYETH